MSVVAESLSESLVGPAGARPGSPGRRRPRPVAAAVPAEAQAARPARVDQLQVRHHLRSTGLDENHVAALAELDGDWPSLVVWAQHPEVVLDGAHRLAAARRLGMTTVKVVAFDGSPDEAFAEAVRRNIGHGLPLSLADRARAGQHMLLRNPDWSDRRIAESCALSPHTVARLRATILAKQRRPADAPADPGRVGGDGVDGGASVVDIDSRLGKDGKRRPAQTGFVRERVVEALRANPGGSLRDIAGVAKVSPETVRRIKRDFDADRAPDRSPAPAGRPPAGWHEDPALTSMPELHDLLAWLERTDPGDELCRHAHSVPISRIYQLADEARRRSAAWAAFATALESRARGRGTAYSLG